ncbi:bifunctional metallophosphatase/5'-nucleotidase [Desulfovibrio sp. TomC]|uniref:bifunctional metallophosphatase/5'-nucleotidase n=1 Tax=Desulfovibrio sp. TomC TaxID=1562888 RepID=UPI0005757F3E|nr:bifunctional metallophosphatase/5'-nucleotidase [Desulfovibrio sp. TomC]KHK01884.1 5'-nucleotidase [Desulfovibrio sp. TomC]
MLRFKAVGLFLGIWLLAATALAGGDYTLTILYTNDIHAHLAAFDEFGAFCDKAKDAAGKCQGGAARLATAVARERAKGGNSLLLDAGDQFQGTLFFTKYKGEASAFFMNRLGYDAMTLGNHEFDDGPATLANFIRSLKFPMLGANVDVTASPDLKGLVAPYIIREIGGKKVGIIGLGQPKTAQMSSPGPTVTFAAAAGPVKKALAELQAKGVRIIIVLSHLGLTGDKKLAATVPGIDIIVGGHSHVLLGNDFPEAVGPSPLVIDGPDGGKTRIVTAGYWGRYLGSLTAAFDADGHVATMTGNPIRLDAAMPEDPATLAEVDRFAKPLDAFRATVVGQTVNALGAAMCRQEECTAGDVLAESLLAGGRRFGATMALVNGGSIRAGIAPGPITLGDVLTASPFPNTLTVLTLTGADLKAALEHGVAHVGLTDGTGRFPQVAGLTYTYNPAAPAGSRIVAVETADASGHFTPLNPNADYRLAVSDFLFRGGDGYAMFGKNGRDVEADGMAVADLIATWLGQNNPLRLELDGRIAVAQ